MIFDRGSYYLGVAAGVVAVVLPTVWNLWAYRRDQRRSTVKGAAGTVAAGKGDGEEGSLRLGNLLLECRVLCLKCDNLSMKLGLFMLELRNGLAVLDPAPEEPAPADDPADDQFADYGLEHGEMLRAPGAGGQAGKGGGR